MSQVNVVALIPARTGSKGIPGKNFRVLPGASRSLVQMAADCAAAAGIAHITVIGDVGCYDVDDAGRMRIGVDLGPPITHWMVRPTILARDDSPMLGVVQHYLRETDGPDDQAILLLQPTQPLRTPAHLTAAIALLRDSDADSVVSVVPVKPTDHALWQGQIAPDGSVDHAWDVVTRRQDIPPAVKRDGTVYAFCRRTVDTYGSLYGRVCRPLLIDPADTCELDTLDDWAALERRLEGATWTNRVTG